MYWVLGPMNYDTNQDPTDSSVNLFGGFFQNPNNMDSCLHNFGRSATALRRVMQYYLGVNPVPPELEIKESALNKALLAYYDVLEPFSKKLLSDIGLDLDKLSTF